MKKSLHGMGSHQIVRRVVNKANKRVAKLIGKSPEAVTKYQLPAKVDNPFESGCRNPLDPIKKLIDATVSIHGRQAAIDIFGWFAAQYDLAVIDNEVLKELDTSTIIKSEHAVIKEVAEANSALGNLIEVKNADGLSINIEKIDNVIAEYEEADNAINLQLALLKKKKAELERGK